MRCIWANKNSENQLFTGKEFISPDLFKKSLGLWANYFVIWVNRKIYYQSNK